MVVGGQRGRGGEARFQGRRMHRNQDLLNRTRTHERGFDWRVVWNWDRAGCDGECEGGDDGDGCRGGSEGGREGSEWAGGRCRCGRSSMEWSEWILE